MSLGCGACRLTIFGSFGMLYRLVLDSQGDFVYKVPNGEYVPPNGAVCEACWSAAPTCEAIKDEKTAKYAAAYGGVVYAFQGGDSMRMSGAGAGILGLRGAAQWSSVETSGDFVYFRGVNVQAWSPKLVEVIDWDAENKLYCAKEEAALAEVTRAARGARNVELYGKDPHNRPATPPPTATARRRKV